MFLKLFIYIKIRFKYILIKKKSIFIFFNIQRYVKNIFIYIIMSNNWVDFQSGCGTCKASTDYVQYYGSGGKKMAKKTKKAKKDQGGKKKTHKTNKKARKSHKKTKKINKKMN